MQAQGESYLWVAGVLPRGKHVHLIHNLNDVGAKRPEDNAEVPFLRACDYISLILKEEHS